MYQASHADPDELAYLIHLNERQLAVLEQLQDELNRFEVRDDSNHISEMEEAIFKSKWLLERLDMSTVTPQDKTETHENLEVDLHLPQLNGDLSSWPEFWELYKAAIRQNTNLFGR